MGKINISKEDIITIIYANRKQIIRFGVKRLGLFGSFVRGEQTETSDIDLLVEFTEGKKNYDNFIQLSFFLEKILDHKVELITSESISPYIKPYIINEVEYATFIS